MPKLVPRYIRAIEALGVRRGFSVDIRIETLGLSNAGRLSRPAAPGAGEDLMLAHLVGEWRGSKKQFSSLKFTRLGGRIPMREGAVPMLASSPVLAGWIEVHGNRVCFTPYFGLVPVRLENRGDVEVIHYLERIGFHGTVKALTAAGIAPERLTPTRSRNWRRGSTDEDFGECRWDMRCQPDGKVLYIEDTPLGAAKHAGFERRLEACRDPALELRMSPNPPETPRPSYLH